MITIKLSSLNGEKTSLEIDEKCTYEELYEKMRSSVTLPKNSRTKLVFNGKILKRGTNIADCGITNGSFVVYVSSPKKHNEKKNSSNQSAIQTPDQTLDQTPSQIPVQIRFQTLDQIPVQIPVQIPDQQSINVPPLETFLNPQMLFGMRSMLIAFAIEKIVSDKQLLLSILNESPKFQNLIRSPNGLLVALAVNHPNFLSAEIFREMKGSAIEEVKEYTDRNNTQSTPMSLDVQSTPISPDIREQQDIDEILQIFPGRARDYIARLYTQSGKNKEATVNAILQI